MTIIMEDVFPLNVIFLDSWSPFSESSSELYLLDEVVWREVGNLEVYYFSLWLHHKIIINLIIYLLMLKYCIIIIVILDE